MSIFSAVWDHFRAELVLYAHVVNASSEWWCFPDSDWLLTHIGTHTCAYTHTHTLTRNDSHTRTLILIHILQPTDTNTKTHTRPDAYEKVHQQQWKYEAHFQGTHRVLKEKPISSVPNLIDFESGFKAAVVFCLSVNDTTTPAIHKPTDKGKELRDCQKLRVGWGGAVCEYNYDFIITVARWY